MSNINPSTDGAPFERAFLIEVARLNNGTGVVAAGVTILMPLAGLRILGTDTEIITPSVAAALTFGVGDTGAATRFQALTDARAVAGTIVTQAAYLPPANYGFSSAANLTITWGHTATSGVLVLRVWGAERRAQPRPSV